MGRQKEDLYRNFSRKDLQGLCKKYGLPANKSNSEMATSLILYLEKKNLNSRTIWEAARSDPFPSGTTELQAGTMISPAGDRRKDFKGTMSHSGSGNNQCHNQVVQQNDLQNCKDPSTSDKASKDVGSTKVHRDSTSGAGLPENTLSYVVRSSVQAPSPHFQFDVSSEDGIQLYVDLNSSPSDWIESLKDGVHICRDMHKLESPSFHQLGWLCCPKQMKGSSLIDSYEEMGNGEVEEGSYPITSDMGTQEQPNVPEGAEGSLSSPGHNPCATVHSAENLVEEEATTSSRNECDAENQVCGANICLGSEGALSADPDANVVTQLRTCNNYSGKSLSSDPKCSGILENQDLNVGTDIYEEPSLQQTYGSPEPALICLGSPDFSVEMRGSRGNANTSDQDKAGILLDFTNQPQGTGIEQCGLIHSKESAHQTHPIKTADQTEPASCSTWMNSHLLGSIDRKQHQVEARHGKAYTPSNSSWQVLEASKHLTNSHIKSTSLSPYLNCEPQGVVSLTNSIKMENGGFLCSYGASQEAVQMHSSVMVVQRNDASLSSCSNGGSLDLVVPKQNGGSCTAAESIEPVVDVHDNHPTSIENLGRVSSGDQWKTSECLDFRESTEETWKKSANSGISRELKRKRQVNGAEGHSLTVKPDAKILRTSKQFVGDVHASRRRSSRLFTK